MFSFLLRFLITNLISGVIFTEPEVSVDADANINADYATASTAATFVTFATFGSFAKFVTFTADFA